MKRPYGKDFHGLREDMYFCAPPLQLKSAYQSLTHKVHVKIIKSSECNTRRMVIHRVKG